jgi:hypothetical protein
MLPSSLQVVEREMITGGAVGFHFSALLLLGSDDKAGIPVSIEDVSKVTRGEVMEVTASLLVRLDGAVPAFGALRVDEPAVFLLEVICIIYLDVG